MTPEQIAAADFFQRLRNGVSSLSPGQSFELRGPTTVIGTPEFNETIDEMDLTFWAMADPFESGTGIFSATKNQTVIVKGNPA